MTSFWILFMKSCMSLIGMMEVYVSSESPASLILLAYAILMPTFQMWRFNTKL